MNGSTSSDAVDPGLGVTTPSPVKQSLRLSSSSSSKDDKQITPSIKRSNSTRSKGINFNVAISPLAINQTPPSLKGSHRKTGSYDAKNLHLPKLPESSPSSSTPDSPIPSASEELKYDLPLPLMEQLMGMDIDDQLRLLALKEMSIVEIKDSIGNLNSKLQRNEKELHSLREVIQKSLYKELNSSTSKLKNEAQSNTNVTRPQRQNSNPREEAIASTKNRTRRRTLSSSSGGAAPVLLSQQSTQNPDKQDRRNSTLWSNLSKPLNLIQQFDSMLQHEFEKSMIPQQNREIPSRTTHSHKSRHSEDSISSLGSISSPLNSKSKSISEKPSNDELDQYFAQQSGISKSKTDGVIPKGNHMNSDDMLQAVSSSIWSFVNDVKTNVLSSLGDEEAPESGGHVTKGPLDFTNSDNQKDINDLTLYNLDIGSTVSFEKNEDSDLENTFVHNTMSVDGTIVDDKSKND
ncbi:Topoisomerase I damage affected protein 11 [Debaryomyces fabryi]|uniref:Topoisomerase I damage affected protein 11 n=1 Tax=Debaryomyces fabryi TaxID=58627 RepID=A0A0V1Q3H8_9ASCO|nr:Topoisomerase I damage affected protein 11 [Debaryomyces fabryi]KSA03027.1 Topoisomerase I damage affected protein 11 [Debaryomyces fabryi]CUM49224.1 unnamed protein product [Debaryomyces fabryi]